MVSQAQASVGLGATRVIYPGGSKQVQLPVTNNDEKKTFLIQSWIENEEGKKVLVEFDVKLVPTDPPVSLPDDRSTPESTKGQSPLN